MFAKNLRLFYLYLVSFIALLTSIYALYGTSHSIMNIIIEPNWPGYDRNSGLRELFNMCAFWVVGIPVYYFHWQAIKNERKTRKVSEQSEVAEKWES